MSYDLIKNGLVTLLNGIGFAESENVEGFDDAPGSEYGNTFILKCESGEMEAINDDQMALLYDNQKWTVQIAFTRSSQNDKEQRDEIHRKRDELLVELDNPENWRSFCTILRYKNWSMTEQQSYFLLNIEFKIKDALTY